ncbi:MAG: tetratricopeptide repeat protein [Thiotrichales bacterium]|nr:tetratricopeptide repeat protein [Thiotrichales bacterium]
MSLINQMLNDLESRQAYLEERSDSVLNGLHHSDVYESEERNSHVRLLFIVLLVISIGCLIYGVSRFSSQVHVTGNSAWKLLSGNDAVRQATVENQAFKSAITPVVMDDEKDPVNTGLIADAPVPDGPLMLLALTDNIRVPATGQPGVAAPENTETGIRSLSVIDTNGVISIDLQLSDQTEYSLFTLEDPHRLVVELDGIDPPDTDVLRNHYPDSVKLCTRNEKENYQLIFEFPYPVSLQDTQVTELDKGVSLQIALHTPVDKAATDSTVSGAGSPDQVNIEQELFLSGAEVVDVSKPVLEKKVLKADSVRLSEDLHREGMIAYRDDNVINAIDKLYSSISSNSKNHKARVGLAEILIQQGDTGAARELLVDGLAMQPAHSKMARILAQILAGEQNNRLALYYLERALPDLREDVEYHALVAALLQREARHQEAILFYRNVLNVNAENGIWWMGLGISLEATGAVQQALSAYQRARSDSTISSNVANYLDGRIDQLHRKLTS